MAYSFAVFLSRLLLKRYADCQVYGLDRVPEKGPVLFVANHQSLADAPLLMALLPRPLWFLAARWILNLPLVGWFLRLCHARPVATGRIEKESLKWAEETLKKGQCLVLFPEGGVSRDGKLGKFHRGAAFLALRTGTPIVPIGIVGTAEVMPLKKWWPRRARIFVTIGSPFSLAEGSLEHPTHAQIEEGTHQIRRRVRDLLPPRIAGEPGPGEVSPQNLPEMFRRSLERWPQMPLWGRVIGESVQWWTYEEVWEASQALAAQLIASGVQKGDRIALLSENRPEWGIVDLGILCTGAINVPLYPSFKEREIQYVLEDAEPSFLFVSTEEQYKKIKDFWQKYSFIKGTILFEKTPYEEVSNLEDWIEKGKKVLQTYSQLVEERIAQVRPEDIASFVYTSGTTGEPRGALLTHSNFLFDLESAAQVAPVGPGDCLVSIGTLAHIMERLAGLYGSIRVGMSVGYLTNLFALKKELTLYQPTVALWAPRVFTALRSQALTASASKGKIGEKIFHWAERVALHRSAYLLERRRAPLVLSLQAKVADLFVYRRMKKALGGRLKLIISGAAALPVPIGAFYIGMGFQVLEGYGLSETTAVVTLNPPEKPKLGSIGKPIPGIEVWLAEDGEILCKGPNIFVGYWKKPEETQQAIESDGTFHTGDLGSFDEEGYLYFTGRKKSIIVLINGENIPAEPIEAELETSEWISRAVVLGSERPYLVALIVPRWEALERYARQHHLDPKRSLLKDHPQVRKLFWEEIRRLSGHRRDFEQVKAFALLEEDFSVERGEITPTQKVRRHIIQQNYADLIKSLYREG